MRTGQAIECGFDSGSVFAWRIEWARGDGGASVKWFTDGEKMRDMISEMDGLGWNIAKRDIYQKTN